MLPSNNPEQPYLEIDRELSEEDEEVLLEDINKSIEQIENKEVVNKEKITNLPLKRKKREHKRKRATHFT